MGSSNKLNTIWMGPLLVVEVINPVLYRVHDCKWEYVLHHDLLKCCEDRVVPLWLRKLRHEIMDLDTTIAYDEAEQEDETIPEKVKSMGEVDEEEIEEIRPLPEGGSLAGKSTEGCSKDISPGSPNASGGSTEECSKDANPGTDTTLKANKGDQVGGSTPDEDLDLGDIPTSTDDGVSPLDWVEGTPARVSWIDETRDLGLKSLFSETPVLHIYGRQGNSTEKGKGKRGYSPVESVSRAGRQHKVPAHLQDYRY